MIKNLLLPILLFLSVLANGQSYTNVDAPAFKQMIEKNDGIILDTRTPNEFNRGHIEGAKLINLTSSSVKAELLALPKEKPLYVYCYSGSRSRSVATFLSQNGFSNVVNLQKGVMDWSRNGFPLVTGAVVAAAPQPDQFSPAEFDKTVNSQTLVFVDFYAPWCAPCKRMMPLITELKHTYEGKVKVVKVNTDASKALAQREAIRSIPYFVLYENGKPVYTKMGMLSREELEKLFNEHL